ncbi:hypothetical protein ACF0H5_021592 [Mactra antiquata]
MTRQLYTVNEIVMSTGGMGKPESINNSFSARYTRRNIECSKLNVVLIAALVVVVIIVVGLVPVYINVSNTAATPTTMSSTETYNQTTSPEHSNGLYVGEAIMSETIETSYQLRLHRINIERNISNWKMEFGTSSTIEQSTEPGFIMLEIIHKMATAYNKNLSELQNNATKKMLFYDTIQDVCPVMTSCSNQVMSSPYSTLDGSCNNLMHADWGMSSTPFRRDLPPDYADGIGNPRMYSVDGTMLPSPRTISNIVHRPTVPRKQDINSTVMVMAFGQFLSHDIVSTPSAISRHRSPLDCCLESEPLSGPYKSCYNILIEPNDEFFGNRSCMSFTRSAPAPCTNCDICLLLINDDNGMFPWKPGTGSTCPMSNGVFATGDDRANLVPNFTVLQLIFVRLHNHIATQLLEVNSHWKDNELFLTARKILIAVMQNIAYGEYLPSILGSETMTRYNLDLSDDFQLVYNRNTNAAASNAFATAAFRFGHSTIPETQITLNKEFNVDSVHFIEDTFNKPDLMLTDSTGIARWLVHFNGSKSNGLFSDGVRNMMFLDRTKSVSTDLVSLNIQRGRDHGIPSYNSWRQFCQLPVITQLEFNQLGTAMGDFEPVVADKFRRVYRHPDDIDLFSGGMKETSLFGAQVGPTFACILGDNFSRLKTGDRFYFENPFQLTGFNIDQLMSIKNLKFAKVVCDTMNIRRLSVNVFFPNRGVDVNCEDLDDIDYTLWME